MSIPLIDLKAQYSRIQPEIDTAIQQTISQTAFIGGESVAQFEQEFGGYLGASQVVSCGNGTDALEIILRTLNIGSGDEVLVPTMSWVATSEVVVTAGATPVFVDVNPGTYTINPQEAAQKITERTKAIMPVHLYGHPADMPAIMQLAETHKLWVIEDCAQAHGATINGKKAGTWGHAAGFSFFPSKNLGCYGDGGAMAFREEKHAEQARTIARHGQQTRHHHVLHGRNSRLDGLQAAILLAKLQYLDQWLSEKQQVAYQYTERLAELAPIVCPSEQAGYQHAWHLYVIRTSERDQLKQMLQRQGIQTGIHYPTALPFLPCYQDLNHQPEDFPITSQYQPEILSLPMYAELTESQVDFISQTIADFFN
ncbi:DegT/DnrJ/EryC1/StrS family aminotransferase [Tunicatimonas pelagia]|uniref:DegT/DnrJ/EryC1/StrS family aminotransferase n=1 Tax=Tunicatimonas pelagia TaxID=931531 RepID=UPI002666A9A5|nr:DegT/DnrJ/EryC1/StrS family aminotransferase [Tunicatimonas pelagia]WKN45150.1 DegT/DnrJ/EryC1/StrS family aminotransferase [Tunicatimonas pelagia]